MPKRRESKRLRAEQQPSGIWHAVGSVGRKRIRKSLGTRDEGRANELLAAYEAKLWKRSIYGDEAVRTFEEAAMSYMLQGGEARFLPRLIKHFKGRTLVTIKPAELRSAAAALYPSAGAATRNRQGIIPARAVIMHAHDLGWCAPVKVKQFEVPKSIKHKAVDRAWMDAFMAEADKSLLPHLSALALFMHQTGARVSEAVRLSGEHVDLPNRLALLEKTKTGTWSPRELTLELVARIAALKPRSETPVFGYTDPKAVNRVAKRVAIRAGIEPLSTHSFGRHSFGTNSLALTKDIKGVMDAGDWKSAKLFMETYVHSRDAGRTIASKYDEQAGPIDMNKPLSLKRRLGNARKP